MPADALWMFDGDLFVGNQCIVTKAETAGGLGAALARAFAGQPTPHQLDLIRKAAQRSTYGDNVVANMQLAFAGLSRVNVLQPRDTRQPGSDPLGKYDPNQPRVPAGSGSESGRWTDGEGAASPVQDRPRPPSLYHPIANAGDPRNNKMARDAAVAVGLTQDQRQDLHRAISGRGLSYQDILEIAKAIAAGTY